MLVCHCKAIYDERIREEIADGARDEFDIAERCGAGSVCGGCVSAVTKLLGECAGCPVRGAVGRVPATAGGHIAAG